MTWGRVGGVFSRAFTINSDESLSSPPAHNKTEDGWFIYNDTQYFINTDTMDMESARAFCKKNFGDLAVITGDSERRFLWKLVLNTEHTHVHPPTKMQNFQFLLLWSSTDIQGLLWPVLHWHVSEFR